MSKKPIIQDPGDAIRANARCRELGWSVNVAAGKEPLPPISPPETITPQTLTPAQRPSIPALRFQPGSVSPAPPPTNGAAAPPPLPSPGSALQPTPPPTFAQRRKRRSRKGWSLPLVLLMGTGIMGSLGAVSFVWLMSLPPATDCNRVSALSPDAEQLYCARQAAQSGDVDSLRRSLELVQDWSDRHPLYTEAQNLTEQWSRALLDQAQQRYANSDLKGAIEVAGYVPESSPIYADAQTAIAAWQTEWSQGEAVMAVAQDALQQRDWGAASEQLLELGQLESAYWREQQVAALTEQIVAEREAWRVLQEARKQVRRETPESLRGAIAQLDAINPQTYVWQAAQEELQRWGNALAEEGLQHWQAGNTQAALDIAQSIPPELPLEGEARYLMQLGHAQQLAQWDVTTDWEPSLMQIWRLREAIAALQQIPPTSPFFAPAQANLQQWQAQLADVNQLQWASAIASVGSRPALELAQYQASQLGLDRPRRMQAQTLVAHWGQQVERLQDIPLFRHAEAIAAAEEIPALERAIALLQQIPDSRALFTDAQQAIQTWTAQIQTLEDQPILDRATTLANDGNLRQAIREARRIETGRTLHANAQEAIQTWQAEIDQRLIAEDRPILAEAESLAADGSLSLAIDVASQIGRDRPLYNEARASIRQWEAEREIIWEQWAAEEAASQSYEEPTYYEPAPTYTPQPEYNTTGPGYYNDYAPASNY